MDYPWYQVLDQLEKGIRNKTSVIFYMALRIPYPRYGS